MKNILKTITIASCVLFVNAHAGEITDGIRGLIEKKQKEIDPVTGKTTDEWFEDYEKKLSFNRQEWEERKKKIYKNQAKETEEQYPHRSKEYREVSARFSGAYMMYETFKDEKAKGWILEQSSQREEIKKYLEELKREYEIADKKYIKYLREKGTK